MCIRRLIGLALAVSMFSGCAGDGSSRSFPDRADLTQDDDQGEVRWPFWPTQMRIHPLTRITDDEDDENKLIIAARVEFHDPDDHITRGYGQIAIDLHDLSDSGAGSPVLVTWNVDLRDLDRNLEHYDTVTRTYLFRLRIAREQMPAKAELRAYFLAADGGRMQSQFRLPDG